MLLLYENTWYVLVLIPLCPRGHTLLGDESGPGRELLPHTLVSTLVCVCVCMLCQLANASWVCGGCSYSSAATLDASQPPPPPPIPPISPEVTRGVFAELKRETIESADKNKETEKKRTKKKNIGKSTV